MGELVDFSDFEIIVSSYSGACRKDAAVYEGSQYLLKYEEGNSITKNNDLEGSTRNTHLSEHMGCSVYRLCGIDAQETVLGTCNGRNVVACKDFIAEREDATGERYRLVEFRSLLNSTFDSSEVDSTPDYHQVMEVLESHPALEAVRAEATERFWQTFVMDALIGNFDRHAGNWGYIAKGRESLVEALAPVYDCGSSMSPKLSEDSMVRLRGDLEAIRDRALTFPRAKLSVEGRTVAYHEFLLSPLGADCRKVLVDLFPRIDLARIGSMIDAVPGMSAEAKEYHRNFVAVRRDVILRPAYDLALREAGPDRRYAAARDISSSYAAASGERRPPLPGMSVL